MSAIDEKNQIEAIENVSNESRDRIAEDAKGGDLSEMPEGYYRSWRFLGSFLAVTFMAQGLYLGESPAHAGIYGR
jgi:hypothetical protein